MKRFVLIILLAVILGCFAYIFYSPAPKATEILSYDEYEWTEPRPPYMLPIATIITKNNITGCGSMRYKKLHSTVFALACSPAEDVWEFYSVNLATGSIIKMPDDAYSKPTN